MHAQVILAVLLFANLLPKALGSFTVSHPGESVVQNPKHPVSMRECQDMPTGSNPWLGCPVQSRPIIIQIYTKKINVAGMLLVK